MKIPLQISSLSIVFLVPVASLTAQWVETFPGDSIAADWAEMQALGDNYNVTWVDSDWNVSGGRLNVDDVVPTASGNYTADIVFRRAVEDLGDFQSSFEFGWNMTSPVEDTLVENRKAVPRILLRLLDTNLDTVVEVGFEDQGYSGSDSTGFLVADLDVPKLAGHPYSHRVANADIVGDASFDVVREGEDVFIYQDGGETPIVTGSSLAPIAHAELVFGRRHFDALDDEFFGEAFVNEVSVIPEPSVLAYLAGFGGLFLFVRNRFAGRQRKRSA